jgi:hypothetical protein
VADTPTDHSRLGPLNRLLISRLSTPTVGEIMKLG